MKNKFSIAMSLAVILAMLITALAFADGIPTISTEFSDYAPGDIVNLVGAGWQGGESVHIFVNDNVGSSWSLNSNPDAVADANGDFAYQFQLPNWFVATYSVTATGTLSGTATTTFTDGVTGVSVGAQNGTLSAGTAGSVTYPVHFDGNGGGSQTFSVSGLPAGTSGSFNPASGNSWPMDSTLTITMLNTTPAGTYTFTVSAGSKSGNGTLKITGDTTAPTASPMQNPAANANGWNNSDVTVSWNWLDNAGGSGLDSAHCITTSTSSGEGTITLNATCKDLAGNTGSASYVVKVDKTAPGIAFVGPSTTPWYNANVTANWSCSDALSGPVSTSVSATTSGEGSAQSATGTCTDNAGNTASNTQSFKVDQTAPTITAAATTAANANGWYKTNVTIHFTCSDALSGVASCPADATLSSDGANQSISGTAIDNAGNGASASVTGINIDKAAPTASASASPAANANGWNNTNVTVSFSGNDGTGSGIDFCDTAVVLIAEEANQSASGTCTDKAGNVSAPATKTGINIDKTAPTLDGAPTTAPNANGWYNGDVIVAWTCSDGLSGIDGSCPANSTVTGEGSNLSASASVSDLAGNSTSNTVSGIKIDRTAPVVTITADHDANANGWYNSVIKFTINGSDALSQGVTCDSIPDYSAPDNASALVSASCTDAASNTGSGSFSFKYDATAPVINAQRDTAPNGNGWNNTDVASSYTASDALSGLVSPATGSFTFTLEGAAQSHIFTVSDEAGNSVSATVSGVNIDKTDPTISAALDKTPAPSGWYNASTGTPTVSFTCNDTLSGLAGACPASHSFSDGEDQVYNQTIFDLAGNSASAGVSNIDVDTTAPSINTSVNPARPAGGWWNIASGAPTVTFTCTDGTSGVASCTSPYTFGEGADQTQSGTAVDNAGNSASASVNDIDVDLTAPVVTVTPARGTDHNGWYNAPVSFSFSATDATSGPDSCDPDVNYNGPDSANANVSGSCTDQAGNIGSANTTFKYDNTDPLISASVTPVASGTGWWNIASGAPTVTYTCSDDTAGVESCTPAFTFGEGENQTHSGTVVDNAGNSASASVSNIDVDLTAPAILISAPANNGSYSLNASVASAYSCTDGTSGVDTCAGPVASGANFSTNPVGGYSFAVSASDKSGNSASASATYSVLYATSGMCYGGPGHTILQPINADGTSVSKQGSTVPAKFRVCDAYGNSVGTPGVVSSFVLKQIISGTITDSVNEIVDSTTPYTEFRWDSTSQQWIFNISTKNLSKNKTYVYLITLNDGSTIQFQFGMK